MAPSFTSGEILAITIVVVLSVVAIALFLWVLSRLRRRKAELLNELKDRPELVSDRAFNRIAMARREAELLAGQGKEVGRARELIAQAQSAFDLRSYPRAYELAQQAHESLVNARRDSGFVLPSAPRPLPPGSSFAAPSAAAPPMPAAPPAGLPKNRVESQFQLRLLVQELQRSKPSAPASSEAADLRARAQAAFDRGDFTEAFRLALRGRRALGGTVEALPPVPGTPAAVAGAARPVAGPDGDASQSAERVAGGERCPDCGYPALAGDAFCRGCGRPRTPGTCPQCGTARSASDTFCGGCGAPFG